MQYTLLTRGLSNIADGRMFVVSHLDEFDTWTINDFPLPTEDNELYKLQINGQDPESLEPVTVDSKLICAVCAKKLTRMVELRYQFWIYSAFYCLKHPLKQIYLDIFPQHHPGGIDESVNSFNTSFLGSEVEYLKKGARPYLLTPTGTKPQKVRLRIWAWIERRHLNLLRLKWKWQRRPSLTELKNRLRRRKNLKQDRKRRLRAFNFFRNMRPK